MAFLYSENVFKGYSPNPLIEEVKFKSNIMLKLEDFESIQLPLDNLKDVGGGGSTSWEPDSSKGTMVMYDTIDDAFCTTIIATGDNSQCDSHGGCN